MVIFRCLFVVREDITPGLSSREQAEKEGICLANQPDFLLYLATYSGGYAYRHVMIPRLIDSLAELLPSDDMYLACVAANKRIRMELEAQNLLAQSLPKIESTLQKKLCIGKEFPPLTPNDPANSLTSSTATVVHTVIQALLVQSPAVQSPVTEQTEEEVNEDTGVMASE
jgi:hypothetical protein